MGACTACKNRSHHGYKMFHFPRDKKMRKLWETKVGRKKSWKATDNTLLCEAHFYPDQIVWKFNGKKKLRKDVVPAIFDHSPKDRNRELLTVFKSEDELINDTLMNIHLDHPYSSNEKDTQKKESKRIIEDKDSFVLKCSHEDCLVEIDQHVDLSLGSNMDVDTSPDRTHEDVLMKAISVLKGKLVEQRKKHMQEMAEQKSRHNSVIAKLAASERERKKLDKNLEFFAEDQRRFLQRKSMQGVAWHEDTVKTALKLRFACGANGYEALLKEGFPFPCTRTLQKRSNTELDILD